MEIRSFKNQITAILVTVIIAITIIGSVFFLSRLNFYIRDSSAAVSKDGEVVNTISVSGDGKVYVKPDMVTINTSVSETASTSKKALEEVNKKINKIKKVALEKGVDEEDLKTTNFSIRPNYEWKNRSYVYQGQEASQSLDITMRDISIKSDKITEVIDSISEVSGVRMGWIRFDIYDKTEYYSKARALAFEKAKQKAGELASLGEVELLEPVSINDASVDYGKMRYESTNAYKSTIASDESTSTEISTGQLEVTIRLSVKFGIG
jgi:uncharacterized protein